MAPWYVRRGVINSLPSLGLQVTTSKQVSSPLQYGNPALLWLVFDVEVVWRSAGKRTRVRSPGSVAKYHRPAPVQRSLHMSSVVEDCVCIM